MVYVKPIKDSAAITSKEVNQLIIDTIDTVKNNIKIRRIAEMKNPGVVIVANSNKDISQIMENKKLKNKGLELDLPKKMEPRINNCL